MKIDTLLEVIHQVIRRAGADSPEEVELCIEGLHNDLLRELAARLRTAYISSRCEDGVYREELEISGQRIVVGVRRLEI